MAVNSVNPEKMQGKDYITCGIFSALCILALLIAAVFNMSGYTALFYPAAASLLIGVLFVILITKVQKRGAVVIFSIVPCTYFFTSGLIEGMIGAGAVLLFAAAAEAILWNNHSSMKRISLACILYTMYLSVAGFAENFIATDTYCNSALAHGINETVVEQMRIAFSIKPLWLVVIAATALCTFAGTQIGKRIMKKHLKKAGIV